MLRWIIIILIVLVKEGTQVMKNKLIVVINVLLLCAMVVHIGVKMYLHAQHPEYSAPVYAELINAVYYLIPLVLINVANWIWPKKQ